MDWYSILFLLIGIIALNITYYYSYESLNRDLIFGKQKSNGVKLFGRGLSVLLFWVFIPNLFQPTEILHIIGGINNARYVLLTLLTWANNITVAFLIIDPYFEKRESKDFAVFVAPIVILVNVLFYKDMNINMLGSYDFTHWRSCLFATQLFIMSLLSCRRIVQYIKEKEFNFNIKRTLKCIGFIALYLLGYMPVFLPQLFFGLLGEDYATHGYNLTHRCLIYLIIIIVFLSFLIFNKKSYTERYYFLLNFALSGFIEYFTKQPDRTAIGSFPFHLCNTAILLMFFAFAFKSDGLFYFTYLVNVLGALCAVLMPNTGDAGVTSLADVTFWYNHIYAIVIPIIAVMLRVFERPNIVRFRRAVWVFTAYVIIMAFVNGWFNNSPSLNPNREAIDYFFLYSEFFVGKLSFIAPIRQNFIWRFTIGDTTLKIYYMYVFTIYIVFIGLMFATWGFFAIFYKTEDTHRELRRQSRMMQAEKAKLLAEMNGRSIDEPFNLEAKDMIKFEHFSKVYAGSNRKSVDDFNLEVNDGEVIGFIGHNGAGKSTTIKSLVGIQSITEGRIEVEGYDVEHQAIQAKMQMGYVSDNHEVYEKLTGREYCYYVADLYKVNKKDRDEAFEKYVNKFGMEKSIDGEIKSYSHGMKQKLMVIAALVHNPKVWVLDEPLTGLDPTSSYLIKQCMREHADKGNIVFFSSHVLEVVEKICDRIVIITNGQIKCVLTMKEIEERHQTLEEIYLGYIKEAYQQSGDVKLI